MDINIWGKSIWACIHYVALGYPVAPSYSDKEKYKQFFLTLGPVLPCYKCSVNFQKHLTEIPIDPYLENQEKLFEWTVKLHNLVNKENSKPTYTVEQAKQYYLKGESKPKSNFNASYLIVSGFVILMVVFLLRKSI